MYLIGSIGLDTQSVVTLYIYRVGKTYPVRNPVYRFVNKISCGVSLPHPINIKGHGRLKEQPNRIYQKHIFYLFTFTLLFQPRHAVLLSSPWRLRTP